MADTAGCDLAPGAGSRYSRAALIGGLAFTYHSQRLNSTVMELNRELARFRQGRGCPASSSRKPCRSRFLSQLPQDQNALEKSPTSSEGPFGEVLRATGPMAKVNPIRWSTKYTDDETDLVMYPYRPYSPSLGRWLSRDPIEEKGGPNLFHFVQNCPTCFVDPLGLYSIDNPGNFPSDEVVQINRKLVDACSKRFGSLVTDTGCLRDCIKKMCGEGKVVLSPETPRHVANGEWVQTLGKAGAPGSNPGRCTTITLYPKNGKSDTDWGGVAIHESAHCCGWKHNQPGLSGSIGGSTM